MKLTISNVSGALFVAGVELALLEGGAPLAAHLILLGAIGGTYAFIRFMARGMA